MLPIDPTVRIASPVVPVGPERGLHRAANLGAVGQTEGRGCKSKCKRDGRSERRRQVVVEARGGTPISVRNTKFQKPTRPPALVSSVDAQRFDRLDAGGGPRRPSGGDEHHQQQCGRRGGVDRRIPSADAPQMRFDQPGAEGERQPLSGIGRTRRRVPAAERTLLPHRTGRSERAGSIDLADAITSFLERTARR